ncbi:activating molecule in BECN1-regulated autophagy protein 1-like [Galendromus occidentalis]|uniref:Activating molecule in BECN1-regulated autophagy protein 1-like n=1 Tax=Galendromus occidentalis TaxID=34638 RepID=A0AAJ7L7K3_9ACAR|nr:activating molecule in BECN1-regulated autophagy protein 1-like [Galendromus occidentalis]
MKRKRNSMLDLLTQRQLHPGRARTELQEYAEDKAAHFEMEEMPCKLPVSVRSTFLMCFSPNGSRVASTHGDHRIYVCKVTTGELLKTLEGHPRTPWCLAFHPTCNDLLASGCLGGEVRVWDLSGGGSEVWVCPERSVITSLTFHPTENFIALSTVNRVHFWDWSKPEPFVTTKTNSEREKVRLVRFTPRGDYLLTGITNAFTERPQPHRRNSTLHRLMTMYNRMTDMFPGLQESTVQRRIARRGGVRMVNTDDLLEMLQRPNIERNLSMYLRQWSDRTRSGSAGAQEREEHPISRLFRIMDSRRPSSYPAENAPESPANIPGSTSGNSSSTTRSSRATAASSVAGAAEAASGSRQGMPSTSHSHPPPQARKRPQPTPQYPPPRAPSTTPPDSTFMTASSFTSRVTPTPTSTFTTTSSTQTSAPSSSSSSSPDQSSRATDGGSRSRGEGPDLWWTFNQLRMLCTRLELRMMRHGEYFPGRPAGAASATTSTASSAAASSSAAAAMSEPRMASGTATPTRLSSPMMAPLFSSSPPGQSSTSRISSGSMTPPPPPPPPRTRTRTFSASSDPAENSQHIPISLVHLLNRLQESLQSLSDATARQGIIAARRQIREVRIRISDILERLENVSEYRERLRSLRAQIVRAAARMYDPGDEEEPAMSVSSPQWDLAYCVWLVDMSLRLTNEMQRLLTADYRLIRFHSRRSARRARYEYERAASGSTPASANLLTIESSDSESDSDNEAGPSNIPPFPPPPFRPPPNYLPRYAGPGLGAGLITHRIQYWCINQKEPIPQISDPEAQLVVATCKIHNDGSVDVSPCGQLLVALVPDTSGVTLSVFSLNAASMGQVLYTWGFGPNAVSLSFSPLSRYVVVGLASSRYMSPQREVVTQIFRLGERPTNGQTGSSLLEHVANMSQPLLGAHASQQLISLNCVRWLPNPGEGLVYGTNRGTLCICRPLCSFCHECSSDGASSSDGVSSRSRSTRRDSSFQSLSLHIEETATRHALLGRRPSF